MPFDDDIKNESMTSTMVWTAGVVFAAAILAFLATQ